MNHNDFDKFLKETFEAGTLNHRPSAWNALEQRLSPRRKVFFFAGFRIAAAVILIAALTIGLLALFGNNEKNSLQPSLAEKINPTTGQNKIATKSPHITFKNKANTNFTSSLKQPSTTFSKGKQTNKPSLTNPTLPPSTHHQKNSTSEQVTVAEHFKTLSPTTRPSKPASVASNVSSTTLKSKKHQKQNIRQTRLSASDEFVVKNRFQLDQNGLIFKDAKPTNRANQIASPKPDAMVVSIGGGAKYGSMSMGYAVGINARKPLGKQVFIGGSISFQYSNPTDPVQRYAATPAQPTRPLPGQMNTTNTVTPVTNFYYLDVNPTIGYQAAHSLSLSVGPDIQRRLGQEQFGGTTVFTPGDDPRIIPAIDFGITQKTDFTITPQIALGLVLRTGVNNWIKKQKVHPYLNRRYVQLQLNYNFVRAGNDDL